MNPCRDIRVSGRRLPAAAVALALGWLAGCGGPAVRMDLPQPPPPTPPTELTLDVKASPHMNPTAGGQSAPLLVRIYELAASGSFKGADQTRLLDADQQALGSDLLGRQEERFVPGERRLIERTLNPGTRSLGVMAAYRLTDGVIWRTTAPIVPAAPNALVLVLGPRGIKLSPATEPEGGAPARQPRG